MFYIIRGSGYRSKGKTDNEIEIYEEFRDENPLVAREKCFSSFLSLIDVLLQGINKKYTSHEQAEKDLEDYIFSHKNLTKLGLPYVENGVGFSISFVYDETIEYQNENITIYKGEKTIHGIQNEAGNDLKQIYFDNLIFERLFYKKMKYQIKNEIKDDVYYKFISPIDFSLKNNLNPLIDFIPENLDDFLIKAKNSKKIDVTIYYENGNTNQKAITFNHSKRSDLYESVSNLSIIKNDKWKSEKIFKLICRVNE